MDDTITYKKSALGFNINKSKLPLNRHKTYAELKEKIVNGNKIEKIKLTSDKQNDSFSYDGKKFKLKKNWEIVKEKQHLLVLEKQGYKIFIPKKGGVMNLFYKGGIISRIVIKPQQSDILLTRVKSWGDSVMSMTNGSFI